MADIKKVELALLAMQRHSWEQGVAMQAFWELGRADIAIAMAKEAAYRRGEDGRAALTYSGSGPTDACSPGEVMIWALAQTGDEDLGIAVKALENWALKLAPRSAQGVVYHVMEAPELWVDGIYMLPPYLCAAGHYDEALKQLDGYWNALHDPDKNLMSHIWDDQKKTFRRKAFWGVGNGWTVAGLARVIDLLPASMKANRDRLIQRNIALIDSLLCYARPDGLFHDVVDDPSTFPEVNLSQMVAYAIYRGIASGWLDSSYLRKADALRDAAHARVDRFGLVQQVCGAPHFDKPGVAPEGNAFFLLMEAARAKIA